MIERFYQDNKVKDIRIGDKRILRVLNQGKAVYPNVIRDGLVLHYDFRGYTNDNLKRGIAYDLSGNGNHGELKNFAFSEGSGYDGQGLVFDGVDDYIQLPTLGLDADDFTVMMNDKIFSYRGEDVAQVVDGDVEIGGRNLLLDSGIVVANDFHNRQYLSLSTPTIIGQTYTFSIKCDDIGDAILVLYDDTTVSAGKYIGRLNRVGISNVFAITFKAVDAFIAIRIRDLGDRTVSTTTYADKLGKGNKSTDWTPAPEDLLLLNQIPIFSNNIKTMLYWNRALSDTEILKMYNLYKNN